MSFFVTPFGVILLIILVLFILSVSPLTITVTLHYQSGQQMARIDVRYLRIFHYGRKLITMPDDDAQPTQKEHAAQDVAEPEPDSVPSIESFLTRFRDGISEFDRLWPSIQKLLMVFSVSRLSWQTEVGVDDAAVTAWLYGVFWTIQAMLVGVVSRFMRMKKPPDLMVIPHFQQRFFTSNISCIVTGPLGKAIVAGVRLFLLYKKGDSYARTSNSVSNADGHGKLEGNG